MRPISAPDQSQFQARVILMKKNRPRPYLTLFGFLAFMLLPALVAFSQTPL